MRIGARVRVAAMGAALILSVWTRAYADSAQEQREQNENNIPQCTHKIGTMSIIEPENHWWVQYNLGSPEALLKIF